MKNQPPPTTGPWITGRQLTALRRIYQRLQRLYPAVTDLDADLGGWMTADMSADLVDAVFAALDACENLLMCRGRERALPPDDDAAEPESPTAPPRRS